MFTLCVNNFNIKDFQEFVAERKKTARYGLETISYRCPQLWTLEPDTMKQSSSWIDFKLKIYCGNVQNALGNFAQLI